MRKRLSRKRERRRKDFLENRSREKVEDRAGQRSVSPDLEENLKIIASLLGDSADVITRRFTIQYTPDRRAAILYVDGMCEAELVVNDHAFRPLMLQGEQIRTKTDLLEMIKQSLIHIGETKYTAKLNDLVDAILAGDAVLFVDGYGEGIIIGAKGYPNRSVQDPRSESVIRGSREGFIEAIRSNTAMIRHRLKDPDLRVKSMKLGKRTRTDIAVLYIEGVADQAIVTEVMKRLEKIEIDGVLESGYIEEFIEDHTWTPFPQVQNTERPDAVVAHLLEGKVAVVVDGTPNVLITPAVFSQFFFSPEDYYERYLIATILRFLRLIALFIALLLPTLYIAFASFHVEMIPQKLAIAMAAGRATVPFPSLVEALAMEISVEILREASVRLPGVIGPTIGIVGALVVGEAAVTAGLVSPLMVIVVGLTTISSYATPSYNAAISIRMLRFPLMITAAILGLPGVILALLLLLLHLVKLRSFGVPYLAPFTPLRWADLKDSLIRVPWKFMRARPTIMRPGDDRREKTGGSRSGMDQPGGNQAGRSPQGSGSSAKESRAVPEESDGGQGQGGTRGGRDDGGQ